MSLPSPPICTWRPGDGEALRIALFISVTPAALTALNREVAQLQTRYPTGVCTAKGHLDVIADLDQQLAALTPACVNSPGKGWPSVLEFASRLLLKDTESQWIHLDPKPLSARRATGLTQPITRLTRDTPLGASLAAVLNEANRDL